MINWNVRVLSWQAFLYLQSKIEKRAWVLHECLERVADDLDAMRELLSFGLKGTDVEALIAIGSDDDDGSFMICDVASAYDENMESPEVMTQEQRKKREREHRQNLLRDVDFSKCVGNYYKMTKVINS